jgi:AraC-like DNA-binding protein
MSSLVTTDGIAPARRFPLWVDSVTRSMGVSVDCRSAQQSRFHGEAFGATLGDLRVDVVTASPMQVRRLSRHVAHHDGNSYKIALQVAGTAVVEQDGRHCRLEPGDLVCCDTSRLYSFGYDSDFRTVIALIPRSLISIRPDTVGGVTARRIGAQRGTPAVVGSFLHSIIQQRDSIAALSANRLSDSATALFTALLTEHLSQCQPAGPTPPMLLRIHDHIEHHLADPDLNPERIAATLGISTRYVYKLFAADNTTVAAWIRARRLQRCARDLADPAIKDKSVSRIAARWGLPDSGHFARAFKTAYGDTPRDYRKRALAVAQITSG